MAWGSGSYKYVHILVSLRNTSLKFLVARIPNPVARKKLTRRNTLIFVRAIGVNHHVVPHPRKFIAPSCHETKGSNAKLLVFMLALSGLRPYTSYFVFSFVVLVSPVFVRFPPHVKPDFKSPTNFNGSGSALKLPVTNVHPGTRVVKRPNAAYL